VVSLAGYAGVANKQMISFAFIYNGSIDESKVREFFDKVLTEIVSN
jgi:D-alanyl-D-alanine carboxypeptidase/D-alanyl-D-alanine-endopeptidase (penicillin-binding protein 4)